MLYGEEIHVFDAQAQAERPIDLDAGTGAVFTVAPAIMGIVKAFGIKVSTAFYYDTATVLSTLKLYRYPAGSSGSKVELCSLSLVDGLAQYKQIIKNVLNTVTVQTPIQRGIAMYNMGDLLVAEITAQGAGGTYLAGAFYPFIWVNHRGEPFANQTMVVDQTAARSPAY